MGEVRGGGLTEYARRLTRLRTDVNAAHYPGQPGHLAPHKPLLLLSVMDLIAEGTLTANLVGPTPDLAELFALYWSKVMPPDRRGLLAYPFFHLKSEGFWHLVPVPGREDVLAATRTVSSVPQLKSLALGARLDDDLFALLQDPATREALRAALLDRYFTPEMRPALLAQASTNVQAYRYSRDLLDAARSEPFGGASVAAEALPPPARDQDFRRPRMAQCRERREAQERPEGRRHRLRAPLRFLRHPHDHTRRPHRRGGRAHRAVERVEER